MAEGADVFLCIARADVFGRNIIGIRIIKDKHIFVAVGGHDGVATGQIHGNEVLHINSIQDENATVMDFAAQLRWEFRLGAADVLPDQFLVAKGHFFFLGAVFMDALEGETGPAGKETAVNSINSCRNG